MRGFLERTAQIVEPVPLPLNSCRDPKDVPVLGSAVAAGANVLITVDNDLLVLGEFRGLGIA